MQASFTTCLGFDLVFSISVTFLDELHQISDFEYGSKKLLLHRKLLRVMLRCCLIPSASLRKVQVDEETADGSENTLPDDLLRRANDPRGSRIEGLKETQ